eukprot:CAMPEP_0197046366 /NCGR_PEP_ID=MMETSP1384-20130603/22093_1 /TAXON_ID=29189 /ORGANISM="Ammonia sp." /LENGTH=128 /DNA_ID=CAMNT_0042478141 /DNA_START=1 /DNA_END=385 /DNA_ORIENTATION=-
MQYAGYVCTGSNDCIPRAQLDEAVEVDVANDDATLPMAASPEIDRFVGVSAFDYVLTNAVWFLLTLVICVCADRVKNFAAASLCDPFRANRVRRNLNPSFLVKTAKIITAAPNSSFEDTMSISYAGFA